MIDGAPYSRRGERDGAGDASSSLGARGGDPGQVADTLYPGGGESHYATVQKLLERLEKKGFVRHERREGILVFEVTVDRDEFLEHGSRSWRRSFAAAP